MKVDSVKLDILRFAGGCVEPTFSVEEATVISARFGKAFNRVVNEINRISGLSQEAADETENRFPGSGAGEAGAGGADSANGPARPAVPPRTRAGTGDDGS